jgi:serine O-acetyltransferase
MIFISLLGFAYSSRGHRVAGMYFNGSNTLLNHLYSDHHIMLLWFLSNETYKVLNNEDLASKFYYLNKSLHGIDCMFDTKMPNIFLIFHGVGTMLGKATYSDYFVVLQGCTVGNNKGIYPTFQKGVALAAHSSVIGNCKVGNLVTISSNTNVFDNNIEDNNVVFKDEFGKTVSKKTKNSFAQSFFNEPII